MKTALYLPNFGLFADPKVVTQVAVEAEEAGWDGLFLWDHVVRHEGDFPVGDPWVLLAGALAATTRLLAGPMVTPLPRRRPWNVGRAALTLDHLSDGRFVLGVGVGSARGPELAEFGEETDARTRGDMLDEGLAVLRDMWTGEVVDHHGAHYTVDGLRFLPTPTQPGGIPVWGATESLRGRPVRRAAALDGIFPIGITPDEVPQLLATVAEHRQSDGAFDVAVIDMADPATASRPSPPDRRRWDGSGATWWLRLLGHDAALEDVRHVVGAGA